MKVAKSTKRRLALFVFSLSLVYFLSVFRASVTSQNLALVGQAAKRSFYLDAAATSDVQEPIHVVLTASASYTVGLYPLINSTLVHTSPISRARFRFHIVSASDQEARQIVMSLLRLYSDVLVKSQLIAYGLQDETRFDGLAVWASYRSASLSQPIVYARYILPALLPLSVEKAIYLDQDVLVRDDLANLWDVDLEGKPLAAARLCRSTALWHKQFVLSKPALKNSGFDAMTCSLNNGVLVYNMTSWRLSGLNGVSFTDQLLSWSLKNSQDKLYNLGSQPPFCLVFYRNYKVLEDKWNLMDLAGLREETAIEYPYTRSPEEVATASILHWNGLFKPWHCGGEGYYSEIWTQYFPSEIDQAMEEPPAGVCDNLVITSPSVAPSIEQFTVVIVAFARIDTIVRIVKHLEHSLYVKEIIVAWNNQEVGCPEELDLPWVRCLQQSANLVHNRFLIWSQVQTEAVLHYDDDLLAPLEDLEAGFQVWRSHRDSILGFEPRVILCDQEQDWDTCGYGFKLKDGYFDLIIGKLFFVSRTYMQAYFQHVDLVALSSVAPCEDLAMSFLVSSTNTDSPAPRAPLLFKSNLTEIHSTQFAGLSQGISSTTWRSERSSCVRRLIRIFDGRRPGAQRAFYTRDPVRRRVYKLPILGRLEAGWCSDVNGSRPCRQPR